MSFGKQTIGHSEMTYLWSKSLVTFRPIPGLSCMFKKLLFAYSLLICASSLFAQQDIKSPALDSGYKALIPEQTRIADTGGQGLGAYVRNLGPLGEDRSIN